MKRVLVGLPVLMFLGALVLADTGTPKPGGLAPPVKIAVAGEPIDVEIGHAAPFVTDFDGDGRPDLLVGQFGSGRLRIYADVGEGGARDLAPAAWFEAGGADGTVPSG